MCLYVDDILFFGTNLSIVNETKAFLASNFDMKDMGLADVILGLKLTRSTNGIVISQCHYIKKILKKFGYESCGSTTTPYNSSIKLHKNASGNPVSQLRYSQMIGSLMYLANCTRPNITFSLSKLSRFTSCPGKLHWEAVDRVFFYFYLFILFYWQIKGNLYK